MSLEAFEVTHARADLTTELARAAHAAYGLELCERLCAPRVADAEVYLWIEEFLRLLGTSGATVQRLRAFEIGLLVRLGLGLSIDRCVACGRSDFGDDVARWQPERGGLVCRACTSGGLLFTPAVRRALMRLSGLALADADQQRLTADENAGCRHILLEAFAGHLTSPLKSLLFINKMGGAV